MNERQPDLSEVLYTEVYNGLDKATDSASALLEAIDVLSAAGYDPTGLVGNQQQIEGLLREAFDEVKTEDPDIDTVIEKLNLAESSAGRLLRSLPDEADGFELPDRIDTGIRDTFGEFARYIFETVIKTRVDAEQWKREVTSDR